MGLSSRKTKRWAITEKMFFSLLLTGSIIEFSQVGAGFIDGLVISRFLGTDAMAASGIAYPVFSIIGIISGLLSVGMQIRCSQEIGRGNREEFSRFVSSTILVGAVVSVITTIILVLFAVPIAKLLGATGNATTLVDLTSKYLIGIGLGAPALIMTAILAPALQLDTGRKTIQTGAIIGTITNIIMDFVAVKTGLGIFGVGVATAVSSYFNLLFQFTFFRKKDRILYLCKLDVSVREFIQMLKSGTEKAIKRLANTLRPIILNKVIIFYGGSAAMSALSIQNNFSNFAGIFGMGIASAVMLLCGVYYGEINEEKIDAVNQYEHKMVLRFCGTICALMLIFSKQIVNLYISKDSEIYKMAVFAIRLNAIQLPLWSLIESRIKYLQAIHRKKNMNLLIIAENIVFVILSAIVLGRLYGSFGILASYTVGDAITLVSINVFYFIKCRRKPTKKDFLNLPDYFYLNPGDVISLNVTTKEEVSLTSEQIMLFCKGHKINHKTALYASLAFEELASNIVEYGFPYSKASDPMIDVRVVISNNTLVMRLRDNCPQYDVTKQIATVNEPNSDLIHNIGIRIISKTASDITYLNTFETNNLIVQLKLDNHA